MMAEDISVAPSNDMALVKFIRRGRLSGGLKLPIFDGEKFIGVSESRTQFGYLAEPGKHLFVITAENNSFLEANLQAGKTYIVLVEPRIGVFFNRVSFKPIKRNLSRRFNYASVLRDEEVFIKRQPNIAKIEEWESNDVNKAYIKKILATYQSEWKNEYKWPTLEFGDGLPLVRNYDCIKFETRSHRAPKGSKNPFACLFD